MKPDTQKEYSFEVVEKAEELYCVDGLTYEQIANQMKIAQSTLKRWGKRYNWAAKREEIRQALSSIRINTIKLRAELIKNCLESLKPMDAFAVAKIEEMALRARELKQLESIKPIKVREIKTREDAISALTEAIEIRINKLLTQPEQLDFKALKDLREAMDMLQEMKGNIKEEDETGGFSAQAVDEICKNILGVE